jgi:hypothetical protein
MDADRKRFAESKFITRPLAAFYYEKEVDLKIYFDMDGVLTDWDMRAREFGFEPPLARRQARIIL